MSLQSNINTWKGIYDNNPASMLAAAIQHTSVPFSDRRVIIRALGSMIHLLLPRPMKSLISTGNAGQGVPTGGSSGGKFLFGSTNGFSWDTVFSNQRLRPVWLAKSSTNISRRSQVPSR